MHEPARVGGCRRRVGFRQQRRHGGARPAGRCPGRGSGPFDNYAAQRQAVLDTIDAEWILFVDADERATPALMEEVRVVIEP